MKASDFGAHLQDVSLVRTPWKKELWMREAQQKVLQLPERVFASPW
jgi:hypothetical protein